MFIENFKPNTKIQIIKEINLDTSDKLKIIFPNNKFINLDLEK